MFKENSELCHSGSRLLSAGANPSFIASQMGHASAQMGHASAQMVFSVYDERMSDSNDE
ncbi:TPA: hypothetical protein ACPY25_000467 [Yersinia enterocolitica]